MDRVTLADWIERYETAWRTPGTAPLNSLFTPDAAYYPGPFEPALQGMDAIADFWEREREGPDEPFRMTSSIVAVEGDTGVAHIEVWYEGPPPRHYRDLWVVRLDASGRCSAFEEWPFWPEHGTHAGLPTK